MKTSLEQSPNVFPVLKGHVRMKQWPGRTLLLDCRSEVSVMPPREESLMLALCSGCHAVATIVEIYSGTFRLDRGEAERRVGEFLRKFSEFLNFLPSPAESPGARRHDPLLSLQNPGTQPSPSSFRFDSPTSMVFSLTYACNHRCAYCANSSTFRRAGELSSEQWLSVVDQAASLGVLAITFSGGEPMMHPGFLDIIARAAGQGIYPVISTNGTFLTEEVIRKLSDAGAEYVHLSLPSVDEFLYDKITGSRAHLPLAKKALLDLKRHRFLVRLKVVVTSLNVDKIEELLDLCVECAVDSVHLAPFRLTHVSRSGPELLPSIAQLDRVRGVADKKRRLGGVLPLIRMDPGDLAWRTPEDIVKCGGIKSNLTILPDGDIAFCEALGSRSEFVLGNVGNTAIRDVWNSKAPERTADVRVHAPLIEEPCSSCEHLARCGTGCFMCSLIYSDNPWSVDPRCWKANIRDNPFRGGSK